VLTGVAASERALQETFKTWHQRDPTCAWRALRSHSHQAMFEVEGTEWPGGAIAQVVLPGYAYHERLVRPDFCRSRQRWRRGETDRPDVPSTAKRIRRGVHRKFEKLTASRYLPEAG
jgi:hypothetical protein